MQFESKKKSVRLRLHGVFKAVAMATIYSLAKLKPHSSALAQ